MYNEDEEKNVAFYIVFLSCYRIRENEDVKKRCFFFFFFLVLSIRAHHHRIYIHVDIHYKSLESLVKSYAYVIIDIRRSHHYQLNI